MTTTQAPTRWELPIDVIDPDPENRTAGLDAGFVRSVQTHGVIVPVTVRPADAEGRWLLVAGHRRLAAARQAGLTTVPAVEQHTDEAGHVIVQTIENLYRVDLTPIEEARQCARAVGTGMTRKDLANALARPATWVRDRLKLLELPDEAQAAIDGGDIALSDAKHLAVLADHPDALAELLASPVRDVEWAVSQALGRIEADDALAARLAELADAGVEVVESDRDTCVEHGWKDVRQSLGLDADEHSSEDCHRIVISQGWNGPVETAWCAEPKRHNRTGDSGLTKAGFTDDDMARKAEAREARRRHKLVDDARNDWLTARIARCPQRDALDLICRALIDGANTDDAKQAATWLRIEPDDPKAWGAWNNTLATAAEQATSTSGLVRIALAVAIARPGHPDGTTRVEQWMTDAGWTEPDPVDLDG